MDENYRVILQAINHPVRRKILERLREKRHLSFNELSEYVGVRDHGKLGFHLRALTGLVEHDPSARDYHLTYKGKMAVSLIENVRFLTEMIEQRPKGPGKLVRNLVQGDHSMLLYNTEMFKHEIVFAFLNEGLAKHKAAVYVASESKLDSVNRESQKLGTGFDQIRNGAFTILPSYEWYLKKGRGHAETIIANWLRLLEEKQAAGFEGLYIVGELETFFENAKNRELLRYERILAQQFPPAMNAICLYEIRTLDENQLVRLAKFHDHLITPESIWKMRHTS